MNKRFTSLLTTLILSVFFSISASAGDVEVDGIYYYISETTATVTYGDNKYSGDIVIPESITFENSKYFVTSIGYKAFCGCIGLKSVTIPNSVTCIGQKAFMYCSSLTSITIPNSVTSIEYKAFNECIGLSSVTIPNSVTSIGNSAFEGCSGLTSITIPNSVTCIADYAFLGCIGLTSVTIPNSVTSIGSHAFYECSGLTSVTIPNSVTSIGDDAFNGCIGLTSVTIPNSVTSIGSHAFHECSGLTSVTIPNSVTCIADYAFLGCIGLTSVTIPNSVTSIGGWAFELCDNIENVYCYAEEVPSTDVYAFCNSDIEKATLHVPASAIEAYKITTPWSEFGTIKAIEETVGVESVKDRGIAIQSAAGFITISGLDSTERVDFFSSDGKSLGSAKAMGGIATFAAQSGSVVVAKIGKESVKIAVK